MHFHLTGLPVLSQKLMVKPYIILGSPEPNCQLCFGILSSMAITDNNSSAVGRGRVTFHKLF